MSKMYSNSNQKQYAITLNLCCREIRNNGFFLPVPWPFATISLGVGERWCELQTHDEIFGKIFMEAQKHAKQIAKRFIDDFKCVIEDSERIGNNNPKCRSIVWPNKWNRIKFKRKVGKYPFSSSSIISCFSLNIRMLFYNHFLATLSSFPAGHIHHSPRTSYKTTMAASQLPSILRT